MTSFLCLTVIEAVERERLCKRADLLGAGGQDGGILGRARDAVKDGGNAFHFRPSHAPLGADSTAYPDAIKAAGLVVGDLNRVYTDASLFQCIGKSLSAKSAPTQINNKQMGICSAAENPKAAALQTLAECAGVVHRSLHRCPEGGCCRIEKRVRHSRHRLQMERGDQAGMYAVVQLLCILTLTENKAAARTADGFCGRGAEEVRIRDRAGNDTSSDQAGLMGHIYHEIGSDSFGRPADTLKVNQPRIGAASRNDKLGVQLLGHTL